MCVVDEEEMCVVDEVVMWPVHHPSVEPLLLPGSPVCPSTSGQSVFLELSICVP